MNIFKGKQKRGSVAPDEKLMEELWFGVKDLEINHAGCLSENQRIRLIQHVVEPLQAAWIVGLVLIKLAFIDAVLHLSKQSSGIYAVWAGLGLIVVVSVFSVGPWLDVERNSVRAVSGLIEIYPKKRRNRLTVYDGDQRMTFSISESLADAFYTTERYTVYYLPITKRIISGEHHPL